MSANGWGTPDVAPGGPDPIDGKAANVFDTSDMKTALPATQGGYGTADEKAALAGTNGDGGTATDAKDGTGWVDAQPYNYDTNRPDNWDGNARVYEYDGEIGEVGPEHPELEIILFGELKDRVAHGINFGKIAEIEVSQEGPVCVAPIMSFEGAGLHPVMLRNVQMCGYEVPTPIQKYCIPAIGKGHDVIAVAQTGSGKTAAYMIPILNKLMGKTKKLAAYRPCPDGLNVDLSRPVRAEPLVVIVCPSRELAVQIFNEARKFCYRTMLRPCVVYGGGPVQDQAAQLAKGCDVLVATPGRLIDFIERPHVLTLRRLRYMVIDEADEMLHSDWEEEFNKILTGGEQEEGNIKYMLFSATFPKSARDLARTHLAENHVRLRVGRAGSSHENIKQEVIYVEPPMKRQALYDLILSLDPCRVIIFVNHKRTADELDDFLFNKDLPCTSMHSDRTQKEREAAMRAFRSGNSPILIATGVSARGIDVRNVRHVVNYDLPSIDHGGIEEYTHRIGRTGRIGHRGVATSFYCDSDEPIASVLTRTLMETKQEIPDFLKAYVPEGVSLEDLKFEADSDFDDGEGDGAGGEWGDQGVAAWGGATGDENGDANGSVNGNVNGSVNGNANGHMNGNGTKEDGGAWGAQPSTDNAWGKSTEPQPSTDGAW